MSSHQTQTDLAAAAALIRREQRFVLATHENPDGDALGSLLAMKLALDSTWTARRPCRASTPSCR